MAKAHVEVVIRAVVTDGNAAHRPFAQQLVRGVSRIPALKKTILIHCARQPSDDELRAMHEAVRHV